MARKVFIFLIGFLVFIFIFQFSVVRAEGQESAVSASQKFLGKVANVYEVAKDFFGGIKDWILGAAGNFFYAVKIAFVPENKLLATISLDDGAVSNENDKNSMPNIGTASNISRSQKRIVGVEGGSSRKRGAENNSEELEGFGGGEDFINYDDDGNEEEIEDSFLECGFETKFSPVRNKVIINEVAWAGGEKSSDEWIELKNTTDVKIDISRWQLIDKKEDIKIIFDDGVSIDKNGFYFLKRGEFAFPGVKTDWVYKGALSNKDEGLRLFDTGCGLVDEVLANPSWPAGDDENKHTMERAENFEWYTSAVSGGTPRRLNSNRPFVPVVDSAPVNTATSATSAGSVTSLNWKPDAHDNSSPVTVRITEIMYDVSGSDTGREWIEIYNAGVVSFEATDLKFFEANTNHKISVVKGSSKIEPENYAVIVDDAEKFLTDNPNYSGILLESSFSLSNTGETLGIKKGEVLIYEIAYSKTSGATGDGKSLQLVDGNWRSETPTPGRENAVVQTGTPSGTNVAINEVQVAGVSAGDEFVEIYNPMTEDVSFSGWSLQYLSGSATSLDNISKKNFSSSHVISTGGFFLVARGLDGSGNDGYEGSTPPDMTHRTFSMSGTASGGLVFLVSTTSLVSSLEDENIVDYIAYGNVALPGVSTTSVPNMNQSVERRAWLTGACLSSSQGVYEYEGNGCDSDSGSDFELRITPKPQNTLSLKEPRSAPVIPQGLGSSSIVSYATSSYELSFAWRISSDATGATTSVSYELREGIEIIYSGTSASYTKTASETGRDYNFSLRAFDEEALGSATSSFSITVPRGELLVPVLGTPQFESSSSLAIFTWSTSTVYGFPSAMITYDFNYTTSTELLADGWLSMGSDFSTSTPVVSGVDYLVGARAVDELGNVATSTPLLWNTDS